jgi:2-dehydropantoate 2-reductase
MLWGKLIVNAGINPITAILRLKNGELLDNAIGKDLLVKTVNEAVAVATQRGNCIFRYRELIWLLGIKLPYDNALESVLAVAKATSGNISSMLADVMRGVTTEINAINGVIVNEGERMGLSVQTNRKLVESINNMSTKEQKMYL